MPPWLYFHQAKNKKFHDYSNTALPISIRSVLGLGLNFIPSPPNTIGHNAIDLPRFRRDSLLYNFFSGSESQYERNNLRPPSTWTPDNVPPEFKVRINNFEKEIKRVVIRHRLPSNMLPLQRAGLEFLSQRPDLKVWATDKNLGPIITTTATYIERAHVDHLNDTTTYRELTLSQANGRIIAIRTMVKNFVARFHSTINTFNGNAVTTPTTTGRYILHSLKCEDPFAYFYIIAKIHKTPWKSRPVTSVSGSLLHGLGKWVDSELQKIVKDIPYVTTSSATLVDRLIQLPPLPNNAVLFTADARSMYTNINTEHAIRAISEFFAEDSFVTTFPGIDKDALLRGIEIIMRNSMFKFNNQCFLQLTGCAMGTPPAPPYATLYFYLHERNVIKNFPSCRFYTRYIDDVFGIWIPPDSSTPESDPEWNELRSQFDMFGDLRWDFNLPSKSITFLDLTITIRPDGSIATDLFEKALNLHLFLPPASMHPPGIVRSLVRGMCHRIDRLCTLPDRRKHHLQSFLRHLSQRGHNISALIPIIQDELRYNDVEPEPTPRRNLFIHCDYSTSPTLRRIRPTFKRTIESPKNEPHILLLRNDKNCRLDPFRLIIAYHRQRNLRNILCPRKFSQQPSIARNNHADSDRDVSH